ncbi:MAG: hypothetical protein LLG93_07655 [Deltaproteobacteria bacterium]|nr:hypothetical protein [Deltaproteobacteria bacterium]
MFDLMYDETVQVKRLTAMDSRAKPTFTTVAGAVPCRIERTRRRVVGQDGVEFETDASMNFNRSSAPGIQLQDRVTRSNGEVYRVASLTDQKLLFTDAAYVRADLSVVREP